MSAVLGSEVFAISTAVVEVKIFGTVECLPSQQLDAEHKTCAAASALKGTIPTEASGVKKKKRKQAVISNSPSGWCVCVRGKVYMYADVSRMYLSVNALAGNCCLCKIWHRIKHRSYAAAHVENTLYLNDKKQILVLTY